MLAPPRTGRGPLAHLVTQVLIVALVFGLLPAPTAEALIPPPSAAAAVPVSDRAASPPDLPLTESVPAVLLAVVDASDEGAAPCAVAFAAADPHLPSKYHRARWMDPRLGRFHGMDPFGGFNFDPPSLHRYSHAANDPASKEDPTGMVSLPSVMVVVGVTSVLAASNLGVGSVPSFTSASGIVTLWVKSFAPWAAFWHHLQGRQPRLHHIAGC